MAEIAILGYGTVGSGVLEVLKTNQFNIDKKASQPIRVKYVFDLRDFPDDPVQRMITHDFNDVLNDNDVQVVIETMGGVEPAYSYVKKCLFRGKSVVTSNKELVASHGAELLSIARENNLNFLFEASVGGGIPIIRPLNQSLTADEITEIMGILNGTTNYVLTRMTADRVDFHKALEQAQAMGYAEKDPSADVDGCDACRKIAILLSLAIGRQVNFEDIHTEGIRGITPLDIDYANQAGYVIKLLAMAKIVNLQVFARVSPVILPKLHPLAMVNDVFNAIFVRGNVIDEVMFYGRGAGKLPTASAVVADIIDAVKHLNRNIMSFWSSEKMEIVSIGLLPISKFVRVAYDEKEKALQSVMDLFGAVETMSLEGGKTNREFAFITPKEAEETLDQKINRLKTAAGVKFLPNVIRCEGVGQ